jgi:hypothetical protein
LKGNDNSGVQILQGDGALIMVYSLCVIAMLLIYYYRTKLVKSEKTAEIFAQQIALHNSVDLNDKVFMAALNTDVEHDVYHAMVRNQVKGGVIEAQSMKKKY